MITPPFLFLLNIIYTVITFLLYKEILLQGRDSDSMMDIFLWLYPLIFIVFVFIIIYNNLPWGALLLCLKRLTHSLPEVGHSRRYLQANVFHLGFPGGSVCKEPTGNSVDPSSVRVRKILWRSPWSTKESHRTAHACATMMQQFPAVSV